MKLGQVANEEVGRLLNGTNNSQHAAIAHLSSAAGRAAESLVYLAEIDDRRFKEIWPDDGYQNEVVDDGHVRWAAAGALTSLDLCMAAAVRLGRFAQRPPRGEDSIRDYYRVTQSGKVEDKRHLVRPPWRGWIDGVVGDARYDKLLRVRNALIHADAFRIIHGTTGPLAGHTLRYGYNVGPLVPPVQQSTNQGVGSSNLSGRAKQMKGLHYAAPFSEPGSAEPSSTVVAETRPYRQCQN